MISAPISLSSVARRHRLDRAIGPHRHERRRLDAAAIKSQATAAGLFVGGEEMEVHGVPRMENGEWRIGKAGTGERVDLLFLR
jgi:alkylation response protein AidB-like acyl-CoA dehydrogenase